jgi:ferrochelatase
VAPISFVSEHSETLVELDQEYRRLADAAGVPRYERVPTPTVAAPFIAGLAELVQRALASPDTTISGSPHDACGPGFACPRLRA